MNEGPIVESTEESNRNTDIAVRARFDTIKLRHPAFVLRMHEGFRESSIGSYPVYQRIITAPFVDGSDRQLYASTIITLTKAEWTTDDQARKLEVYNQRRLEALNKLFDWVDAGVVPVRAGAEDQVTVGYWGELNPVTNMPEAQVPRPGQGSGIILTDL